MKYQKETTINRKWRRLLSMLMTVAMLFSANAPSAVYAAGGAGGVTPTSGSDARVAADNAVESEIPAMPTPVKGETSGKFADV